MEIPDLKRYRPHITVVFLTLFMAVALLLRIIPAFITRDQAFFPLYDTDTWYNLRQIEVMVHNFPQYDWFDPMTAYPGGKSIDWGPGFPAAAAIFCIVTGSTTHTAIISASGWISPLMAVLMVPLMYYLGSRIMDWKTGIIAAGLISFSSFIYFTFSSYGMVDHHIAEVLTTTLFITAYLIAVISAGEQPPGWNRPRTTLSFCTLSALAGILLFIALVTSTTVLLILVVVALYTVIQILADFLGEKDSGYLCILNLVMLVTAALLLVLFGFRHGGMNLSTYTPGLVVVLALVATATLALYSLSWIFRGRRSLFLTTLAFLALAGIGISRIVPGLRQVTDHAIGTFFGSSLFSVSVVETLPWSVSGAYEAINVAILLLAGGFIVLGYHLAKRPVRRELILVAVWSVVMLFLTIRFQRFQYYLTVNIVLLSALCITEPFRWDLERVRQKIPFPFSPGPVEAGEKRTPDNQTPPDKAGKKRKSATAQKDSGRNLEWCMAACLGVVCILAVVHAGISLTQDIHYAFGAGDRTISPDWLESLGWLGMKTPEPGIGYFDRYDGQNFTAPDGSYGILAVWDAGHWITFFSHRIPVTNPFQDNLAGAQGAAAFFLSDNETRADAIREKFQTRYVITDSTLAVDQFTNLVPWSSGSTDISRYIRWFLVPDPSDPSHLKKIHLFNGGYFQTMAVRLYAFDGSLVIPDRADYVQYTIRLPTAQETSEASGYSRVITDMQAITLTDANSTSRPVKPEGPDLLPTTYADLFSATPVEPAGKVPALSHYRLVHESPADALVTPFPESASTALQGVKTVKIFEYVKGARIKGEGIIEVPVVTNTGRAFTYRQESSMGQFIVPYSTQGSTGEVRATGPYRIVGSTMSWEVPETAVTGGLDVPAH